MINNIVDFLVGPFLVWLPSIFWWAVFAGAFLTYTSSYVPLRERFQKIILWFASRNYWTLIYIAIGFRVLYAVYISVAQYYVWKNGGDFTNMLASSPLPDAVPGTFFTNLFPGIFQSEFGYVTFYDLGRYGLNVLWSIAVAFMFWAFLRVLKKYNGRFFDTQETELGLLCALIVGWPSLAIFVPLVFISVIVVSIIRGIFFKEAYTTLGYPFLLATLMCLLFGSQLIEMFGLGVLRI